MALGLEKTVGLRAAGFGAAFFANGFGFAAPNSDIGFDAAAFFATGFAFGFGFALGLLDESFEILYAGTTFFAPASRNDFTPGFPLLSAKPELKFKNARVCAQKKKTPHRQSPTLEFASSLPRRRPRVAADYDADDDRQDYDIQL